MKKWTGIIAALLLLTVMAGCGSQQSPAEDGKLLVYASFYPIYDFAQKVGGDKAAVYNMTPVGMDPHDWEPTAGDIAKLESADVFLYNGGGVDSWAQKIIGSLSNRSLVTAEAAAGIAGMDQDPSHDQDKQHDHDQDGQDHDDHDHEGQDPHVWLNPLYAKQEMRAIATAMAKADPANAAYYENNYRTYAVEFDVLDEQYRTALQPHAGKSLVVSHAAFGRLCQAYGLVQMPISGLSPEDEPDAKRMAEIINFVKEQNIKTIFFEELVSDKVAKAIAQNTEAVTAALHPLEGLSDSDLAAGKEYLNVMRSNLSAILKSFE